MVFTRDEIRQLMGILSDHTFIAAGLMYGSGLRIRETMRLRVSDSEFDRLTGRVRDGKGRKSRMAIQSTEDGKQRTDDAGAVKV